MGLEKTLSLFIPEYSTNKQKFDESLRKHLLEYRSGTDEITKEIQTLFEETDLYLHHNIKRRFSLNIRGINPNPESTDKTENQKITEKQILEKIKNLENEIVDLKNRKAILKAERKDKGQRYEKVEWDCIINALNPSNKEGKFSQLAELRRDLEDVKITHYAVLIEKEGNFFLAMESKRNQDSSIKKINQFSLLSLSYGTTAKAFSYNVLTFKALRRLCLEENSSMKSNYFLNISGLSWKETIRQGKRIWLVNRKWRDPKYFKNLVEYLKEITKDDNNEIGVLFSDDQYKQWEKCSNVEELANLIDLQGYQAIWKNISWEKLKDKKGVEIFQLYNKDFLLEKDFATSIRDKEKIERIQKAKKRQGDTFIPKQNRKDRKKDLYTIYWNNFFENKIADKWRLKPEGKFYIRLKDGDKKTKRCVGTEQRINKSRYFENKIFADFGLVVNPTIDFVDANIKTKDNVDRHVTKMNDIYKKDKSDFYILGLDRGC